MARCCGWTDDGTWTILVNSPESIEAIEFMVSLARDAKAVPPNVVEMDYPANVAAFSGGNISMLTTGPWGAQTFMAPTPRSRASSAWRSTRPRPAKRRRCGRDR